METESPDENKSCEKQDNDDVDVPTCLTGPPRRTQWEPGGARRSQVEPGGARRSQEEPAGARGSQEEPREGSLAAGRSQEEARRSYRE